MIINTKYTVYARHVRVHNMQLYVAVGIGGMIGTMMRLIVMIFFFPDTVHIFPYGTLFVNITGTFILTFVTFLPVVKKYLDERVFIAFTTGLLGSYTTFSAIIMETYTIAQLSMKMSLQYLSMTIVGGLFASFLGMLLASKINKRKEHAH